jgi:hypothetical protein
MTTLIIDTGTSIVGIYCVEEAAYTPYYGDNIAEAIRRIESADEVVTYNGKHRDLEDLGRFAGLDHELPLADRHHDMRSICWSDRIWGSSLRDTYSRHFPECPSFPGTYQGSNERDVYMTFKLWELWRAGKLRIVDGQDVPANGPSD